MKIFGTLYEKSMQWSNHQLAPFWLTFVSFIEAIFFPIPPDLILIPMSIKKPKSAIKFALYTAIASVLGGAVGYGLGYYAFDFMQGYIQQWGYQQYWEKAMCWFNEWGILVVFVAGFSPVPYKIFTICAGVMQMSFVPFLLTAFISRAVRFLLIAKLSAWGGKRFATKLHQSIEIIGWTTVIFAIIVYFILK